MCSMAHMPHMFVRPDPPASRSRITPEVNQLWDGRAYRPKAGPGRGSVTGGTWKLDLHESLNEQMLTSMLESLQEKMKLGSLKGHSWRHGGVWQHVMNVLRGRDTVQYSLQHSQ